ncbi:MAG: YbaN family protein [Agarilytica sp.]
MPNRPRFSFKKILLICIGWLALVLGVIGIALPVLPTTPFVLLASWCFAQSSERFHSWLLNHPKLGPLISMWQSGTGIPRIVKVRAILAIIAGMSLSAYIVDRFYVTLLLAITGACVISYLLHLPTAQAEKK